MKVRREAWVWKEEVPTTHQKRSHDGPSHPNRNTIIIINLNNIPRLSPSTRRGTHVKSDNTHTIININHLAHIPDICTLIFSSCAPFTIYLVPLQVITTRAREGGPKEHRAKQKWPRETHSVTYVAGLSTLSDLSRIVAQPPLSFICCPRPPSHHPSREISSSSWICLIALRFHLFIAFTERKKKVPFSMAIGNGELMLSCQDNDDSLVDSWVYWFTRLQVQKQSTSKWIAMTWINSLQIYWEFLPSIVESEKGLSQMAAV